MFWLGFLISGFFLLPFFFFRKRALALGLCFIFFAIGLWRYGETAIKPANDGGNPSVVFGTVVREPILKENSKQLVVRAKEETVLVISDRYSQYQYGDKLKISGELKLPPEFEGFNYRGYFAKEGIYHLVSYPKIELLEKGKGNAVVTALFSFKDRFRGVIQKYLSPPQSGFAEALTLGDEIDFSNVWKEKLNITGTRHIAAVSGMNITIIAFLITSFLISLGFWRSHSFYLSVFLLSLYILMIGAPSSAVRAGLMGVLLMASQNMGRLSSAGAAIVFAAGFMLFSNPLLLKFDVGFQLSFLAIIGIIYLQPILFDCLNKIPNPKFFPARTTLSATFAAQIFVFPILIYNFGTISLISPLANLLIVPFLAPITILIFLFSLSGMIFFPLAFLLLPPAWLSVSYIAFVVDLFSRFPLASLSVVGVHWIWILISYLMLGTAVFSLNERKKRANFLQPS